MSLSDGYKFHNKHGCGPVDDIKKRNMLYRLSMGYHTVSPAPVWVRILGP